MIKGIAHLGICVNSIDKTLELLTKAAGAKELSRIPMPERGQTSSYVSMGSGADAGADTLELMEPLGDAGTVVDFLAKRGEGIHHISLKTDNLTEAIAAFESAGCKIIGRTGDFAFVHPKTAFGVLYELVQINEKELNN